MTSVGRGSKGLRPFVNKTPKVLILKLAATGARHKGETEKMIGSRFKTCIVNLLREDSGAVTVDWVVLSAAVVALAIAAVNVILGDVSGLTNAILNVLTLF